MTIDLGTKGAGKKQQPRTELDLSSTEIVFYNFFSHHFPEIDLVFQFSAVDSWQEDLAERLKIQPRAKPYAADFAHIEAKVLIEIQGGTWLPKGGHSSAKGIGRDYKKENLALLSGWVTWKLTPQAIDFATCQQLSTLIRMRLSSIGNTEETTKLNDYRRVTDRFYLNLI